MVFLKIKKVSGNQKRLGFFFNPAEPQSYIFCYEYCYGTEKSTLPVGLWRVCVSALLVT